jgi:uncharacterized protein YkwD
VRIRECAVVLGITTTLVFTAAGRSGADEAQIGGALAEQGAFSCLSVDETELLLDLNAYRSAKRMPAIRNSRSLNKVARIHAIDLVDNLPELGKDQRGRECNLHSWSNEGFWSPVCYTADHASLARMLSKPREITSWLYTASAYENVYWTSASAVSPHRVLDTWKNSSKHNALILEEGRWQGSAWQALGVGIYRNVAVIWLGAMEDPAGPLPQCAP